MKSSSADKKMMTEITQKYNFELIFTICAKHCDLNICEILNLAYKIKNKVTYYHKLP